MTRNRDVLEELVESGGIAIRRSPIFDEAPTAIARLDADRVEGMLLGVAIGDALGRPSEGRRPEVRRKRFGEIRDYMVGRRATEPIGLPSDDTQLTFWILEQLNEDRGFVPEHVARKIVRGGVIYGMGGTVARARKALKQGVHWTEAGQRSAGNGALMRIAPMLVPHLRSATSELWVDTALSAMMTHNDSSSISSCVAFIDMLWSLLGRASPPPREWWIERYVERASALEDGTTYQPRGGRFAGEPHRCSTFVDEKVRWALERALSTVDACNSWYSGAYMLETMPSVILILARHGHDPEEAILRAVNDTKDNDTIAAIVGAAAGALHGRSAFPRRWIDGLSGRTGDDDDGKVFELLEQTRALWC